jgi:hypothetical protein
MFILKKSGYNVRIPRQHEPCPLGALHPHPTHPTSGFQLPFPTPYGATDP